MEAFGTTGIFLLVAVFHEHMDYIFDMFPPIVRLDSSAKPVMKMLPYGMGTMVPACPFPVLGVLQLLALARDGA